MKGINFYSTNNKTSKYLEQHNDLLFQGNSGSTFWRCLVGILNSVEILLVRKIRNKAIVLVADSLAHCRATIIGGKRWAGGKPLLSKAAFMNVI